jgi:hypothetical protein
MATIIVPALPSAREMEVLLQSLVNDSECEFIKALDLDVSHIDQRAQLYGIRITDVDMTETTLVVTYEVDYNVYNGCKNMDIDDAEELAVSGVRVDTGWEFEEYSPPPKRTTVDEF